MGERVQRFDRACLIPGINIFLDGYVPTENLRFRETSLVFKVAETANEEEVKRLRHYQVSSARVSRPSFLGWVGMLNPPAARL